MLLQLTRGDTGVYTLPLVDVADMADITFTAKRHLLDAVPFIRKTLDDGIDLGGSGDTGMVTVTLEPEDTSDLTHTERFLWDLEVDDGMEVRTPLRGRLVVSMDVTTAGGSGS